MKRVLFLCGLSIGLMATAWGAGKTAETGWRVSGGVSARSICTDFQMDDPGPRSYARLATGKGDVGFFTDLRGVLGYDDGTLGPAYGYAYGVPRSAYDGTASGYFESLTQFRSTHRIYVANAFGPGRHIFYDEVAFHTTRSVNESTYDASPYSGSDDETVLAPYLQVRREIGQVAGAAIDALLGYSFVRSDLSSGERVLGEQTITRKTTRYEYAYDHIGFASGATLPGANFPYEDLTAYTITDVEFANTVGFTSGATTPALAPRKNVSTSRRVEAQYTAVGQVDTEMDLHEILLAPEVTVKLGKIAVLGLAAGPTLNLIEAEMDAELTWEQDGVAISSERVSDDVSDVELGFGIDLSLFVDFTDRLFAQIAAGYRYVPSVDLGSGFASAEIDASSFQGSAGIGIRL